jgi:hypothetical protein
MWAPITRRQHSREHLRYGSDLTDAEWAITAPFVRKHPDQIGFWSVFRVDKGGGRRRETLQGGCPGVLHETECR